MLQLFIIRKKSFSYKQIKYYGSNRKEQPFLAPDRLGQSSPRLHLLTVTEGQANLLSALLPHFMGAHSICYLSCSYKIPHKTTKGRKGLSYSFKGYSPLRWLQHDGRQKRILCIHSQKPKSNAGYSAPFLTFIQPVFYTAYTAHT